VRRVRAAAPRALALAAAVAIVLAGSPTSSVAQTGADPSVENIDWLVTEAPGAGMRFSGAVAVVEDACGSAVEGLTVVDQPSRERPQILERLLLHLDQQHLETAFPDGENAVVDG